MDLDLSYFILFGLAELRTRSLGLCFKLVLHRCDRLCLELDMKSEHGLLDSWAQTTGPTKTAGAQQQPIRFFFVKMCMALSSINHRKIETALKNNSSVVTEV